MGVIVPPHDDRLYGTNGPDRAVEFIHRLSLGDAVNWEILLAGVADSADLVLVSADRDYRSALDDTALDEFLVVEWDERQLSTLSLHTSLSALFRDRYPDIKLAADLEKEIAINNLITSPNFRGTHLAISKLENFADYTPDQIRALVDAAMTNSQVRNILTDADVKAFYEILSSRYLKYIDPESLAWLRDQWADDEPLF